MNIVCPAVTTSSASVITPTTAISGGTITDDGGSPVTARGVCWSTSAGPTVANNKTNDGNGVGTFTSNITGLLPGITYHVRAYATNISGTCYGDEKTFTTSCALPTITTSAINNITQTTATGGGNITSDGGCSVTTRGICYGTSENPTTGGPKFEDGSGTGVFTCSLTGLNPGTLYHVRAYATNSSGTAYGQDITLNTLGGSSDTDNDGDGYSVNQGDCNDSDNKIYPGAPEICGDGIDQDCDGQSDNGICILSVTPSIVYSEIQTNIIMIASDLSLDLYPTHIELLNQISGTINTLDFTWDEETNKINATIPSGITSGSYDIYIENNLGTITYFHDALNISNIVNIKILYVSPATFPTANSTIITIFGDEIDRQFVATPWVFLVSNTDPENLAINIDNVAFINDYTIAATIPAGLQPNNYDLIVVCPNGEIGILPDAITITD